MKKLLALLPALALVAACSLLGSKESPQTSTTISSAESFDDLTYEEFLKALPDSTRQPTQAESTYPTEPGKIFSYIKDPEILKQLENSGYSLTSVLSTVEGKSQNLSSGEPSVNSELTKNSSFYTEVQKIITQDLSELVAEQNAGKSQAVAGIGMAFSHRVFDYHWFNSKKGQYELVGIVNRLDRASFAPKTCGEMRLIYRLSYQSQTPKPVYSRLPMTLMMKFEMPFDKNVGTRSCLPFVEDWVWPQGSDHWDSKTLVEWMKQKPLNAQYFQAANFHSLEVNLQALRVPATVHRNLGGNAHYLLRVFKMAEGHAVPSTLENTPDIPKLKKDPGLLAELKHFVTDQKNFHRLTVGIMLLPEKFLVKRAYSYSPYGTSRFSNRPYDEILTENDFKNLRYYPNSFMTTPYAALKRLNDMSCVGCHQGRATAGFHFLGVDRSSTHALNALQGEGSGHFQSEVVRRDHFLERVRKHLWPRPDRDFSIAPPEGKKAGYGHFCGLTKEGGFSHWQCAEGLECRSSDEMANEANLGKCLPKISLAGDPCMTGRVSKNTFEKDQVVFDRTPINCNEGRGGYICQPVIGPVGTKLGGFPSGMCQKRDCHNLTEGREICGTLAAAGFSVCIADKTKTFTQCLESGSSLGGMGVCNSDRACRNDYVCARVKNSPNGDGACTPSYFLFQVRLDGHPDP